MRRLAFLFCALVGASCSAGAPAGEAGERGAAAALCETSPQSFANFLVGEWSMSMQADEGWEGGGESVVTMAPDRNCAVTEEAEFTLDVGDGRMVESKSTTVIAWDDLRGRWKLLSVDSRGIAHLGVAAAPSEGDWTFTVVHEDGPSADRRIAYRNIEDNSFDWVWQGRDSETDEWHDRLVARYARVER